MRSTSRKRTVRNFIIGVTLAVLAIISGKRPETRSKEGNRAAFRPIHSQPGSGQSRTMGYSATASAPADTATG